MSWHLCYLDVGLHRTARWSHAAELALIGRTVTVREGSNPSAQWLRALVLDYDVDVNLHHVLFEDHTEDWIRVVATTGFASEMATRQPPPAPSDYTCQDILETKLADGAHSQVVGALCEFDRLTVRLSAVSVSVCVCVTV